MQLELKKSFALSNGVRSYLHKIVAACEGVEYILKKNYRHNNALELAIGHAHKIAETNLLKARAKLPKLMTDYLEANTDIDFEPIPKDF